MSSDLDRVQPARRIPLTVLGGYLGAGKTTADQPVVAPTQAGDGSA